MKNDYPFVITIVGAESSGKTVLAKQLAEALSCIWVPEYAREYLEKLDRPYEFEDLVGIARGQVDLLPFRAYLQGDTLPFTPFRGPGGRMELSEFILSLKSLKREMIVVDSGLLTIRMWARIKYGQTIPFVEEAMKKDPTSLYLLCRPRMEWESDPLREAPSLVDRVWIYNQYLNELVMKNYSHEIVSTN